VIYTKPEMVLLAERAACEHGLDPALFCALIDVESEWHQEKAEWATSRADVFGQDVTDELVFRRYRWGLAQILGETARAAGFTGELYELTDASVNVDIAAKALSDMIAMLRDERRALLIWQGEARGNFPERVLAKVASYRDFLASPERAAALPLRRDPAAAESLAAETGHTRS
jgi:hypothetical protein